MILEILLGVLVILYVGYSYAYSRVWLPYVLAWKGGDGALRERSIHTHYNREKYRHILDYDKHSFIINGCPVILLSAEFHYWRLPDASQWEAVLRLYKSMGLNSIRIYFHWGFHSPTQGVYNMTEGNRDIDFLLSICEKLGLYVLAAPGPYICAETQAGGFPLWLLQTNVRIRHSKCLAIKVFDQEFADYCKEWLSHILPILARHQITNSENNNTGCVIALQLENENFECLPTNGPLSFLSIITKIFPGFKFPLGLHDDMRHLAITARQLGMTVPFFTNDAWETGSFIIKKDDPNSFGLDLYGFDKYVVFAPVSEVGSAMVFGPKNGESSVTLPEWDPKDFVKNVDEIESCVRGFGHAAAETPIIIPELQGGWFNHYTIPYHYDTLFNFYTPFFQKLIFDSVLSQGVTCMNYYMGYGGTNWGCLGDPDVYTSYDYSACIREFRFLSERGRYLRLGALFVKGFEKDLVRTEFVDCDDGWRILGCRVHDDSNRDEWVQTLIRDNTLRQKATKVLDIRQRKSLSSDTKFTLIRHFNTPLSATTAFELSIHNPHKNLSTTLSLTIPYKHSFTAISDYAIPNTGLKLIFATTPIHTRFVARENNRDIECWIIESDTFSGELVFEGIVNITQPGTLDSVITHTDSALSSIAFRNSIGWCGITSSNTTELILLALPKHKLLTLNTVSMSVSPSHRFDMLVVGGYVSERDNDSELSIQYIPGMGCDDALIIPTAEYVNNDKRDVFLNNGTGPWDGLPFCHLHQVFTNSGSKRTESSSKIELKNWMRYIPSSSDYDSLPWKEIPISVLKPKPIWKKLFTTSESSEFTPIALGYLSGHILYKCTFKLVIDSPNAEFNLPVNTIQLSINARHRVTVFCNNRVVGGHVSYGLQVGTVGAKMGFDPIWFGTKTYDLTSSVVYGVDLGQQKVSPNSSAAARIMQCEVLILVENFGMNRQVFFFDDARTPRGILSAELISKPTSKRHNLLNGVYDGQVLDERWFCSGVDVTSLTDAYNTSGLEFEKSLIFNENFTNLGENYIYNPTNPFKNEINPHKCIQFYRFEFTPPIYASSQIYQPLQLYISGKFSAYVFLNKLLVGRYHGNGDSPQCSFYLQEGLVSRGGVNEVVLVVYAREFAGMRVEVLPYWLKKGDWSGNWVDVERLDGGEVMFDVWREVMKF